MKVIDSGPRKALYDLRPHGIPASLIVLLTGLYFRILSTLVQREHVQLLSREYRSETGMCGMAWVLGRVVDQSNCGAFVGNTEITSCVC